MALDTRAPGDRPAATTKTPAPDSFSRQSHTENYGSSQYGGKTFDRPGEFTQSPMAQELERAGDRDGTLAQVRARGTAKSEVGYSAKANGVTSDQLRDIG